MKDSFFKLPLILAVCYWLMNSIFYYSLSFILSPEKYMILSDDLLDILLTSFLYGVPQLLFILFVSSIVLFRYHIHTLIAKNILFVVLIAFILSFSMVIIYQGIFYVIWLPLFGETYVSNSFIALAYNISISIMTYGLSGVIVYCGIVLLHNRLGQIDDSYDSLTIKVPTQVHCALFILLFMIISFVTYDWLSLFFYELQYINFSVVCITLIIFSLILYFVLKSSFSYEFKTIALLRLIKSVLLSLLLSFVANAVIGFIFTFATMSILSNLSYSDYSTVLFIALLGGILQLIVACMIIRAVARHYFGPTVMLTQQD